MGIHVSYKLTGSGWSECTVAIKEQRVTITASYLSDAWGDLLAAVVRIVEGETEAMASFTEEPGEYRWRLIRMGSDRLLVRIIEFPDFWGDKPDEEGKLIFDAECRLRTFAGAVLSASQRLLEEHGIEGYLGKWVEHPFPLERQERLRQLLDEPDQGRN
jgi:hypothetical protein